jgi:hypothetical protein
MARVEEMELDVLEVPLIGTPARLSAWATPVDSQSLDAGERGRFRVELQKRGVSGVLGIAEARGQAARVWLKERRSNPRPR